MSPVEVTRIGSARRMKTRIRSTDVMPSNNVCVEWCGEYEIHYTCAPNSRAPVAGPIAVYFPLTGETFSSNFLPTPGLTDRNSSNFIPTARPITGGASSSRDRFEITPEGIRSSNPHITGLKGIVARLFETGGLRHVFRPSAPPSTRWEVVHLKQSPVPLAVESYCEALRKEYSNGFVEARSYRIESGELEDAVISCKRYPSIPTQFLETLRHPSVKADFGIGTLDSECLLRPANWTYFSPFLFSGYLAQVLAYGGAYTPVPQPFSSVSRALKLADDVFSSFHRNYHDLELHTCHKPWCDRFHDVAWDKTWIIFEPSSRLLTILLASDTD